ncbi:MAG TPA: hypothetical protein VMZ28_28555 [Kofleriaceae bacterium]|nr:hypothetical protein [Kofleriaceae bacterium]
MAEDFDALLVPGEAPSGEAVAQTVAERGAGALLRVVPLPAVGLTQIEVRDPRRGTPAIDARLAAALSLPAGRAVWVRRENGRIAVRAFAAGSEADSAIGAEAVTRHLGAPLPQLIAADDGTRQPGLAASGTTAWGAVARRWIAVPAGTPLGIDAFSFHDHGVGNEEGLERMAWLAFDARQASLRFSATPGRVLSAQLAQAPRGAYGPLEHLRGGVLSALDNLGDQTPVEARSTDERVLELCALASANAFAGGEQMAYWDDRVLPLFALDDESAEIPPEERDILDGCDSVLHAMVEIMPFAAPGSLLYSLPDEELTPLAPWAPQHTEYPGSIYTFSAARLVRQVRALDEKRLAARVDAFFLAWHAAVGPSLPYEAWRAAKDAAGARDVERVLAAWTDLRTLLELASANHLQVGVLFYPPQT